MSSEMEDCCYILNLPSEVLIEIFRYLTTSDRDCVSLVCKQWLNIIDSTPVFHNYVLKMDYYEYREIFEESTMNRLISRGRFKNISVRNTPAEVIIEMLRNKGTHVKSLYISPQPIQVLKASAAYLPNLNSLEVHRTSGHDEILDMNSFVNLRKIKGDRKFLRHFLSFSFPLESISFENPSDVSEPNYMLDILSRHAKSLKKIYIKSIINRFEPMVEAWLKTLSKMCCLEDLELKMPDIQEFSIQESLKNGNLGTLKRISLDNISSISPEFQKTLTIYCPNLQALYLCCKGKTVTMMDANLLNIFPPSGALRELTLKTDIPLTDNYVCALVANLPNLQVLDLGEVKNGTDRTFQEIYRHLIHLRDLTLYYCPEGMTVEGLVGASGEYSIQRLKGLNSLIIHGRGTNMTKAFDGLRFNELRKLRLVECFLGIGCFNSLTRNCPAIEEIILLWCECTPEMLKAEVTALKRLQKFQCIDKHFKLFLFKKKNTM